METTMSVGLWVLQGFAPPAYPMWPPPVINQILNNNHLLKNRLRRTAAAKSQGHEHRTTSRPEHF